MAEDIRDLPREFYEEVFNQGNLDRLDEYVTADFVDHEEGPPGIPEGREGVKALVRMYREAFPDIRAEVKQVIVEGDIIAVRGKFSGTHEGEFMGVPASGKRFEVDAVDFVRVEDGKAAEHWGVTDVMGLMQQIGALPAPA
jgi:steroid delta-isomerase-like uncharacterized protein